MYMVQIETWEGCGLNVLRVTFRRLEDAQAFVEAGRAAANFGHATIYKNGLRVG